MSSKVYLKQGEGRTLANKGAWVFDNEIDHIDGTYTNGDIVEIYAFNQFPLGQGYINDQSKIRIRLLSRSIQTKIDDQFIKNQVIAAYTYRKSIMDIRNARLIFAEADFLPGIIVDKFERVLVVQSLALGIEKYKLLIIDTLKDCLAKDKMPIMGVYERSDAKVRSLEGLDKVKGFIGEPFDTKIQITENGVKYWVDIKEGQKTGFFLDQQFNRLAIHKLCKDKLVLDLFTHTGAFALNAALSKAKQVIAVDSSETAIALAKENAVLNKVEDIITFECEDVFEYLPKCIEQKRQYDVVILDPPAFAKSKDSIKNAQRAYREINTQALRLIVDGGYLVTCSCSHFISLEMFTECIGKAGKDAHRRLIQVESRTQAYDHPILWSAEQSNYLKFFIFHVVDEK